MTLEGHHLIGFSSMAGATDGRTISAVNPASGETLAPAYPLAGQAEVERACQLAEDAFLAYRRLPLADRAAFLEAAADNIDALGDTLTERAMAETGLPRARLEGERGRTCGQLRLFAEVLRSGDYLDVRIEDALPERAPMPRPSLAQQQVPLGPVAVFGASNFPLAFSVAGGDTAAALAAGCPVIVKAHSAHPGTSELVGRALQQAAKSSNMPEGVFSLLYGSGSELGQALVKDPRIQAVGFTGSRNGGTALLRTAQARPQPIPVYAEMSSINPVLLLPQHLEANAEALGDAFVASLTMGAGQFCTNPGLILALSGAALERFVEQAGAAVREAAPQLMLTPGIHAAYEQGVAQLVDQPGVSLVAKGKATGHLACPCQPHLLRTSASDFIGNAALHDEVFGACALIVECDSVAQMQQVLTALEGQLTATVHLEEADYALADQLLPLLERRAGRILFNGWPTGVEVCHSMVHGGPWPSTSDSRTTSVGSAAIQRFLRPVCYQAMPEALAPDSLKADNPLGLTRQVNGKR
ncbi:aldehyde dehydrogenase (NADP(+)) [Halomonas sp. OfavH-34-E]|uniref:aldehyde dehydrogenase (NADP(+)) n=1 Tax=Halomonas sp. OfavH-34-E TaxID=2954491 RepID=UPI0020974C2E|nr:aldehyde dehydrogenase (NADP(+)) [Halomonas sp. OfavH-34-E]MCO7215587.1 aldehyde dehydrogenase (NADP(+)) [Halomonas sp. OfavH-34-E]